MRSFLIFCAISVATISQAQTVPIIEWSVINYENALYTSRGMEADAFDRKLQQQGLLPVHRFNTSYLQGIGYFVEFKKTFHYAPGASDIPDEMTPVRYLLNVIRRYQSNEQYKVAILYYDAVDPVSALGSGSTIDTSPVVTTSPGNIVSLDQPATETKNLPDSVRQIKIWYLSAGHLAGVRSELTYNTLSELEAANRRQLKVNELSADRSPRSSRQPLIAVAESEEDLNAGAQLSKGLLPPEILKLMSRDRINGVIIIPYGTIGQVPFHSLPLDDSSYFADRYAFTISPHLSNFNNIVRDNPGKTGTLNRLTTRTPLVVGNPVFFSTDSLQLPSLPGAEAEASMVASMLGTKAFIGSEASYDSVIRRLKTSDFAYFATHAVPSFEDPANQSFLALTPSRSSKTGFLSIAQIQKTVSKKNKLVILSACQTGVGKAYKNGYCNIGRGFFIAGVDNSIISLWNLDDQNIVPFMTILMEELNKPQFFYPAENLRQAILRFKKTNPNPAYWSAMVNFGVCY